MNGAMLWGIVRHLLGYAGAILVTAGYLDDATLQAIIGLIMGAGAVGWSVYSKKPYVEVKAELDKS